MFTCLGENTEKYITSLVQIQKEVQKIGKNGAGIIKTISYRLQSIDSRRYITSSLSSLVNNLAERIHEIKSKFKQDDKKSETCVTKYNYCDCFLK